VSLIFSFLYSLGANQSKEIMAPQRKERKDSGFLYHRFFFFGNIGQDLQKENEFILAMFSKEKRDV
jgi:hypothetical protein